MYIKKDSSTLFALPKIIYLLSSELNIFLLVIFLWSQSRIKNKWRIKNKTHACLIPFQKTTYDLRFLKSSVHTRTGLKNPSKRIYIRLNINPFETYLSYFLVSCLKNWCEDQLILARSPFSPCFDLPPFSTPNYIFLEQSSDGTINSSCRFKWLKLQ